MKRLSHSQRVGGAGAGAVWWARGQLWTAVWPVVGQITERIRDCQLVPLIAHCPVPAAKHPLPRCQGCLGSDVPPRRAGSPVANTVWRPTVRTPSLKRMLRFQPSTTSAGSDCARGGTKTSADLLLPPVIGEPT